MTDADLALYEAKRDGRGQARHYSPRMRAKLERDRAFLVEIERALDDGRVCCVLQPQVSLITGQVTGMEGLGRIRSRMGELLAPAQILPALTESGNLAAFDDKVMQSSLDALASLRGKGACLPQVSINASSNSLRSSDYAARLCRELEARGLTTEDVVVEVLESTLIEGTDDAAIRSINMLRETGIKTIMDDFGSGHATISNLLKLNLDGLKIDKSLIATIEQNKALQAVKAVQNLAENLELDVIVEGVETAEQVALLRGVGCETIQGYWVCEPMEPSAFQAWLEAYGASAVTALQTRLRDIA